MARGRPLLEARQAVLDLMQIVRDWEPATEREKAIYAEALPTVSDLWNTRRQRIIASQHGIPRWEWCAVILGGIITVGTHVPLRPRQSQAPDRPHGDGRPADRAEYLPPPDVRLSVLRRPVRQPRQLSRGLVGLAPKSVHPRVAVSRWPTSRAPGFFTSRVPCSSAWASWHRRSCSSNTLRGEEPPLPACWAVGAFARARHHQFAFDLRYRVSHRSALQICGTPVVLAICDPAEVDVRPRISGAAAI